MAELNAWPSSMLFDDRARPWSAPLVLVRLLSDLLEPGLQGQELLALRRVQALGGAAGALLDHVRAAISATSALVTTCRFERSR